jgi:hypothetical protein
MGAGRLLLPNENVFFVQGIYFYTTGVIYLLALF